MIHHKTSKTMRFIPIIAKSLLAIALLPLPGLAEDMPITAAEFDAYVTGRTLTYAVGGVVYGTEQYKAGRKVIWAFTEDECREGHWYEKDQQICFVYEDPNDPQCWLFYTGTNGLTARFIGDDEASELSEVAQSPGPLSCAGPDVGV